MKASKLLPLFFPSFCLWFLLVLSLCNICFCNEKSDPILCIPTERLALIDLKNNLTDEANRLSSWTGKDCCSWSGVVCDNITGHVHEIHLRGCDDEVYLTNFDYDYNQSLGGTISLSVVNLFQLKHLDLSCNLKLGYSSIPTFMGSFQNLMYLNLSYTYFFGEIPHQLGNLSTLRVLDLHNGGVIRSKSLTWLNNLKGLQHLDMGGINLTEASDWFSVVSNLTSLLELRFPECQLPTVPSNTTRDSFTSLVVLDLSRNFNLEITLPSGWIFGLRNLASLDLSGCIINGVNPGAHGGFNGMSSLRTLRLSGSNFDLSILNGLSSLSNLRLLDVSQCGISSPILGSLQNMSFIEHVDLSLNQIVEEIPKSLSSLCNIVYLDLSYNNFFGNVSELLDRFCECESPKLESLSFYNNDLSGQLPERLGRLKNLNEILLSYNNFTGTIPDTIGGLSSLETLDLSYNILNGSLPESIGRLSKIRFLGLGNNLLTGILTENHFANLTALEDLSIDDNKLVFKVNVNNWIPPFKLKHFAARSCSLGPKFPSWIQSQAGLEQLDVANTNISDTIPNWFWTTFHGISYVNMSHNNIQGKLGDITTLREATTLDLSNNHLHGTLHGNFSRVNFNFLDLSNNNLSGSLQHFLCSNISETIFLEYLNLANNNMSGVIPDCWMNYQSLVILNLEKNQFSGIIPPSLENISSLKSLDVDDNRLNGTLPPWLLNSNSLVLIELARNELTGKISSSIGRNNTSLRVVSLRSNKFEGKIPDEICRLSSIQILDLAHNNLFGILPICFTNFSIISGREATTPFVLYQSTIGTPSGTASLVVNASLVASLVVKGTASLVVKGNTYSYSTILYLVTSLDLSSNKFSGSIPDKLVGLLGLRFLNLSHNNLSGTIPNSFSRMGKLESLDLSMNRLHGIIPLSLSQLTSLNWLNVSYNNLVGIIPTGPQLQTFNESSFTGNALCGTPLPACSQNKSKGTTDIHDEFDGIDWILVTLTLVGLLVGFWMVLIPLFLSRRWRIAYYHFLEEIWFKLQNYIFLLFLRLTKRCRSR